MAKAEAKEYKEEVDKSSNYRPKLFINTDLFDSDELVQAVYRETDKYSITPTTFRTRSFFSPDESVKIRVIEETIAKVTIEVEILGTRLEEFKRYEQESQERLKELSRDVIADGEFVKPDKDILALSEKFIPKITALEIYLKELNQYLAFIKANQGLVITYSDVYANESSEVTRFGISTATMEPLQSQSLAEIYTPIEKKGGSVKSGGSKGIKDDQVPLKMLHPLEVFLIRDAIDYFKSSGSKSVLVDIFARDDNGSIRIKDDKPETHTIVLYRNIEQIIVIDPSNPDFSKHIPMNSIRLFRSDENLVEIIAPLKQKIYAPFDSENVGPRSDQYRDCIDLSVKIAFGLNRLQENIDISDIMSLGVIREITNQKKCNEELFFTDQQAIARIRQASDDIIRMEVNKIVECLDKQRKSMLAYPGVDPESFSEGILIENIAKFNQQFSPNEYRGAVEEFQCHFRDNNTAFKYYMDEVEISLQGMSGVDS